MTSRALGAQISHFLKSRDVEVIFGIPGVHNQELYRGIEEAGLTHVLARHEQGAGFMADGYARASGKPGVAYVITGPGLCNIMTPMGQGYSDSVPMLVISSCLDEVAARRGQLHQMLDQEGAADAVCEWSATANSPEAAYGLLERAFEEFAAKRGRPKHIQVPISQLEAYAPEFPATRKSASLELCDTAGVERVADMLRDARQPLFILGGGAIKADVRELVQRSGAAFFSTFSGRGLIYGKHPNYMGSALARPETAATIAKADLVVVLGSELAEVDIWRRDLGHKAPLVRVDIDPEVLSDHHHADLRILMRIEDFVPQLVGRLADDAQPCSWNSEAIAKDRKVWQAQAEAEFPGVAPILRGLQEAMPEEAMIYSDMTQFAYLAKEIWDMPHPGHWHHPFGFGTLGYALPAAIGGSIARLGLPTVAIAGDYGFQYTMPELGCAVELGLSLPILLWDNQKLKAIEDSMAAAQIAPNAVQALNPDFGALAKAYGALARQPASLSVLQDDLREAFLAKVPTLIYMSSDLLED
jgi:acetolactate synthase-1/2/3 large subunit/5-guanidino-2-oxopentanoate decarboxylase